MQEALARMKEEEERAKREEEERERRLAELEAQRLEQVSRAQRSSVTASCETRKMDTLSMLHIDR